MTAQTGLRISEICSLTINDVHLGTGPHVTCTGKGRRQRITPLTSATVSGSAYLSAAMRSCPVAAMWLPGGGQQFCPVADGCSALVEVRFLPGVPVGFSSYSTGRSPRP